MSHNEGIEVVLSGVCEKVHKQLEKARFYDILATRTSAHTSILPWNVQTK